MSNSGKGERNMITEWKHDDLSGALNRESLMIRLRMKYFYRVTIFEI